MPVTVDAGDAGLAVVAGLPVLQPPWVAAGGPVAALMSTRLGGVSAAPFDSLNLRPPALGGQGMDDPAHIHLNQQRFAQALGARPVWLHQVHGRRVVTLGEADAMPGAPLHQADASISLTPGVACAVQAADCLPLLLCADAGRAVGAAHAGWRGLAGGVVEATVSALCQAAGCGPDRLQVWLGACIGPQAFEVGGDVLQAFGVSPSALHASEAGRCFVPCARADGAPRWLADLAQLARLRLAALGVRQVSGGGWCTVGQASRFFSFRRDGLTGRMGAAIAITG